MSPRGEARSALERFAALVREETGNALPPERAEALEEVAARRARARGYDELAAYVEALAAGRLAGEWRELVPLVTIKESYFFRAPQQFEALRGPGLAQLVGARGGERRLRAWCAACARGEEPATLAIVFAESPELRGWDWRILATDLDEEALEGARRGLYSQRSVAQVPAPMLGRWFERRGASFELDPELRERIEYRQLNLARLPYRPEPGAFDLILLRNLLIYFERPLQRRVAAEVTARLRPAGLLVLGASETLWRIEETMEAVPMGRSFLYRRGGGEAAEAGRRPPQADRAPLPPPLAAAPPAASPPPLALPAAADLLRQAARALHANLPAQARTAVERARESDPGEPAVHALAGRVAELAGSDDEAAAAYRAALYLEPGLFQVRLLLAETLLRLGEQRRALQQAREALTLLDGGRGRALAVLAALELPDGEAARARCNALLRRAPGG